MTPKFKPQFANDDFPIYGDDGGNERNKVSLILDKAARNADPDDEGSFARNSIQMNLVVEIGKRDYESAVSRRRGSRPDYAFMHLVDSKKDRFFVVGDAAMTYVRDFASERKMNKAKFTWDYHGLQFIRGLTVIHGGDLPENLHVVAGYPPLNVEKTDAIINSLQGTWDLDFMGERHKIHVHTVKPIDEILAAAMHLRLTTLGTENGRTSIVNQGQTLGFDLGGGTLDVMLLNNKGYPIAGSLRSAEVGIFDAILAFKEAFDNDKKLSAALGDSTSGLPIEKVYEIFRDPEHLLRGGGLPKGQLDCSELYKEVMYGELNRLYGITKGLVNAVSVAADQVVIFGGAGDLLFKEIAEHIFPNYADNGKLLHGGGILGASIGMAKFGRMLRRAEYQKMER